jgi:hypothetical protein
MRAEHPLYQALTTILKTISIKTGTEQEVNPDLVSECKRIRGKIQEELSGTFQFLEYKRAIADFKEVKEMYVFSRAV